MKVHKERSILNTCSLCRRVEIMHPLGSAWSIPPQDAIGAKDDQYSRQGSPESQRVRHGRLRVEFRPDIVARDGQSELLVSLESNPGEIVVALH